MPRARRALLATAVLLLLGAGCSSERIVLDLEVAAAPNPVAGVPDGARRSWPFTVTIRNPTDVGVYVESMHSEVGETDSGYTSPLQPEDPRVRGSYIPAGGELSFEDLRVSTLFGTAVERRVYHARGDDGRFYSGEVRIGLR